LAWPGNFRRAFWSAVIPGALAVVLLAIGVHEPQAPIDRQKPGTPLHWRVLKDLSPAYWRVVMIGAIFALARFSEAFLILRARQMGLPLALTPAVLVLMNIAYALTAYPAGRLADRMDRRSLLIGGLVILICADLALACSLGLLLTGLGIVLWGLHMGLTQGLLATMVADEAPAKLRGTAFGFFNLVGGVAVLIASGLAGLLWERFGASVTFLAGVIFSGVALTLLFSPPKPEESG